jgi:hypothetical protein
MPTCETTFVDLKMRSVEGTDSFCFWGSKQYTKDGELQVRHNRTVFNMVLLRYTTDYVHGKLVLTLSNNIQRVEAGWN